MDVKDGERRVLRIIPRCFSQSARWRGRRPLEPRFPGVFQTFLPGLLQADWFVIVIVIIDGQSPRLTKLPIARPGRFEGKIHEAADRNEHERGFRSLPRPPHNALDYG